MPQLDQGRQVVPGEPGLGYFAIFDSVDACELQRHLLMRRRIWPHRPFLGPHISAVKPYQVTLRRHPVDADAGIGKRGSVLD